MNPPPEGADEPPYFYVRDKGMAAAHHWDYLTDRNDEALCGHGFEDPVTLGDIPRPRQVCKSCQARLPEYHADWWRARAKALQSDLRLRSGELQFAQSEIANLKNRVHDLEKRSEHQRENIAGLLKKIREGRFGVRGGGTSAGADVKQTPFVRIDGSVDDFADHPVVISSGESELAAATAVKAARDALRELCRARPGAISHHDLNQVLNQVMRSLERTQLVILKSEFRNYGSRLEWARAELRSIGRRMT
ncbi:MAG: hypothetical protein ACKOI2_13670 [Actinomycetota bacterium]